MKIDIDKRYLPKDELNPNHKHKEQADVMYKTIRITFDELWDDINSFIDVGCRDGFVVSNVLEDNKDMVVAGVDYFDWMKDKAPDTISDFYNVWDLRDDLNDNEWMKSFKKDNYFDLVNCTEVGEHIDPDYAEIFLNNLKYLTNKYLIMTWSSHENDKHGQHLNPLGLDVFKKIMNDNGFKEETDLTKRLNQNGSYYKCPEWYLDNGLSVWSVK